MWYPDNVNRRDRAMQLSNDITGIQESVKEAKIALDKSDKQMEPYLEQILQDQGLSSFKDLEDQLMQSLPLSQRKLYADVSTQIHFLVLFS